MAEEIKLRSFDQRVRFIRQHANSSEEIFNNILVEDGLGILKPKGQYQSIVTTIKNWADGRESSGLIIIGNTIASSVLVKAVPQPVSVITNIFIIVNNHPPVLLTVRVDDEDASSQEHNISLATELTDSLSSFTSEQFSILAIVLPKSKFVNVDQFSSALGEAVSEQSKFYINYSLRMPRMKLKNLTRSYLTLISTIHVDGTLWFLTLENFKKLTLMIDSKEVNITGGAVLRMEAARRLDRLGPTVLVVWGGKDIYALRAKKIWSHVCTGKEMKEKMELDSAKQLNVVTLFEQETLSEIPVTGRFLCIRDEITKEEETRLFELRDKTYEEIRGGTELSLLTPSFDYVNKLLDEGKKTMALIGNYEDGLTAAYELLGGLQIKGHEVYLVHSPSDFCLIRNNDKEGIVMIADVLSNTDRRWKSVLKEAFAHVECSTIFLISKARGVFTCEFISDEHHLQQLVRESTSSEREIKHGNERKGKEGSETKIHKPVKRSLKNEVRRLLNLFIGLFIVCVSLAMLPAFIRKKAGL